MTTLKYVLRRSLQTVFLLWFIVTFLFFLFKLMPGDMASVMAPAGASEEYLESFSSRWGLDKPLHVQYYIHIVNYATLNYGNSMAFNQPIVEYLRMKIFNSFILVAPALTFTYLLGAGIGTVLGNFRDTKLERYGLILLIFFGSSPGFFVAIILIIVFAGSFDIFPSTGMLDAGIASQYREAPWWRPYLTKSFLLHYILPFSAITLRYLYIPALIMRTSVIEVSGQDFAFYHRITGLGKVDQLRHIAKHASLPVISNYPLSVAKAFGGLVLIEFVFNWPGIGFTLLESVLNRDLPVIQFVFFLIAFLIVIGNWMVDIAYGVIDPRVSVTE